MAVRAFTDKPSALWSAMKAALKEDSLHDWKLDEDGDLAFESSGERSARAWMKVRILEDRVLFNVLSPSGVHMSTGTYAECHSKLVMLLLDRFDGEIKTVSVTALPTEGDIVAPNSE